MSRNASPQHRSHRPASAHPRARGVVMALALTLGVAAAAECAVSVVVEEHDGGYQVAGEFATTAPPDVAWNVLTDYAHIASFVGSIRGSSVERGADGRLMVRQDATAGVFPLRRTMHVTLDVAEESHHRITFHDVLGRDFRSYAGEWQIRPDAKGTVVRYALEARPKMAMPHVLGRGMISRNVHDLLGQVEAEMLRRDAGAQRLAPEPSAVH